MIGALSQDRAPAFMRQRCYDGCLRRAIPLVRKAAVDEFFMAA
jgi:hypothetical protein